MPVDPLIVQYSTDTLQLYRKKDIPRHCIASLDIAQTGMKIPLYTLEGPVEITAGPDTYVMIGPCRDVYPITREHFDEQYRYSGGIDPQIADIPQLYGWDLSKVRQCRLKKASYIYAKAVDSSFRVFVQEHNASISGCPGDYYAVSVGSDGLSSPYIICAKVMELTYERVTDA